MQKIYFDNNATTPLAPGILEAMLPFLVDRFGNPASNHRFGETARLAVEQARQQIAALLHCSASRLFFTSNGTESNNMAIYSATGAQPAKKHILASRVEHESVLAPLSDLQTRHGYEIELLDVGNQGELDPATLATAIRPDTALVALMAANNETGVLWPMTEYGRICRQRGVLLHCDGVQLAGKGPVDVARLGVDYFALAGHKMHGPKGSAALFVRRGTPLLPLLHGGKQEGGFRAGTENVPAIAGFGAACAAAANDDPTSRVTMLRDKLENTMSAIIPDCIINGQKQPRLGNTCNVSFAGCASGALVQELDERGIAVSAHSACHDGDLDPSHVLRAMRVPESHIHGTLRLSLSRFNTMAEVDVLMKILPEVVARSRRNAAV